MFLVLAQSRNRGRRLVLLLIFLAAGMLCRSALLSSSEAEQVPVLIVDDSVGSDLEILAQQTWTEFMVVFGTRSYCFGDVRLHATQDLGSRAGYDSDSAAVTVRVPGTRAMLEGALVHEWAHHVEFQCAEHQDMRPAFLAAQGLPADAPWRPQLPPDEVPSSMWAAIPSEQYAEAAIELVLGRRPIMTEVVVNPEAVQVIGRWAMGK